MKRTAFVLLFQQTWERGGILTLPWDCERLILGTESLISTVRCQPSPFRCCPAPPRLPLPPQTPHPHPCLLTGSHGPFCSLLHFLPSCFPLCAAVWIFSSESESRSFVSNSLRPHGLYSPWNSPGQNTGVCILSLPQGMISNQESNWGLLHCRWILFQLSYWIFYCLLFYLTCSF